MGENIEIQILSIIQVLQVENPCWYFQYYIFSKISFTRVVWTYFVGLLLSPPRLSSSLWGTGYQRKFSFQLNPPHVISEPVMYSKVSSPITSMIGHTTAVLQKQRLKVIFSLMSFILIQVVFEISIGPLCPLVQCWTLNWIFLYWAHSVKNGL